MWREFMLFDKSNFAVFALNSESYLWFTSCRGNELVRALKIMYSGHNWVAKYKFLVALEMWIIPGVDEFVIMTIFMFTGTTLSWE